MSDKMNTFEVTFETVTLKVKKKIWIKLLTRMQIFVHSVEEETFTLKKIITSICDEPKFA